MAKRILVVEDYEESRSMLVYALRYFGYETIEAVTGMQAVEKAISEKPDIILMDLALPGMTGIDAAKALKQHTTAAQTPIIAYSASNSGYSRERALAAGMVEYLVKPVSVKVIKETIEKYLLP